MRPVQVTFLLGPAGSGKTARCLEEVRAALAGAREGAPLVLLAPKQATFQLERQLLADDALPGYTRLQILSFDRLADFILSELRPAPPRLLSAEGRTMVLRALLERRHGDLQLFGASARRPGFAQQLSGVLRDLQRHRLSPDRLTDLAGKVDAATGLPRKLRDLALMLGAYLDWLGTHGLQDSDCLLDLAAEALRAEARGGKPLHVGGLWLDGFAEMAPQEVHLLAALVPHCERATLAFCLDHEPQEDPAWLSPWAVVGQTFRRCYQAVAALPAVGVRCELLARTSARGRFAGSPALRHLETHWAQPQPFAEAATRRADSHAGPGRARFAGQPDGAGVELSPPEGPAAGRGAGAEAQVPVVPIAAMQEAGELPRVILCADAEAEAELAAREILRHVRAGGRFRECAVLLRQLTQHAEALRRVFQRRGIPFFLDRREPVAHHPLAELTRFALRTAAFGWKPEDWFGALKTGLAPVAERDIDELENAALEFGWAGEAWRRPLKPGPKGDALARLERVRQQLTPPFERLAERLTAAPEPVSGTQLTGALRGLWHELGVEARLQAWGEGATEQTPRSAPGGGATPPPAPTLPASVHLTVWDQMQAWLDNLALAFPGAAEAMPLREWLPVLETGLSGLTVGVIPPALDQVLVGAIDRSRNPELNLALVLGANEGLLPAPPPPDPVLTEADRAELDRRHVFLGPTAKHRLGHERYYAYIACTRARRRLVVTLAARDAEGHPLNPSPFIAHLQRLFPGLNVEPPDPAASWLDSLHPSEVIAPLLERRDGGFAVGSLAAFRELPELVSIVEALRRLRTEEMAARLSPAVAAQLYGPRDLATSVSQLEQFAACPFRFFVSAGLDAEERKRFEVDARERGSFQHEVLARFHAELQAERRRWRDLAPGEAAQRLERIARAVAADYRAGLFQASDQSLFTAESLSRALQQCVETLVEWMRAAYQPEPRAVELAFGREGDPLGPWTLELGDGRRMLFRGKIDRVDLAPRPDGAAWCVVVDYKSGAKKIEPLLLACGAQIQLPAYLAALRRLDNLQSVLGVKELAPAGVFYLSLRGQYQRGDNRNEVLAGVAEARRRAYRHAGRFSLAALAQLDRLAANGGSGQFSYALKQTGEPDRRFADLLSAGDFEALLDGVERQLIAMGQRIFAGEAAVDPYRRGGQPACAHCDYRSICRIDPWTHRYRVLRPEATQD